MVGRWHRKYYHDFISVIALARSSYPHDPVAMDAGILHLLLDDWCSSNLGVKKLLSDAAKRFYRNMRRSKKENKFEKKIKLSPKLLPVVNDLKRLLEARRIYDQFYGVR